MTNPSYSSEQTEFSRSVLDEVLAAVPGAVLIGGWGSWVRTGEPISHDIGLIVSHRDLALLGRYLSVGAVFLTAPQLVRRSAAKGTKSLAGGHREVAPRGDAGDVAGEPDEQPQVLVATSRQALHPVEPPGPQLRAGR